MPVDQTQFTIGQWLTNASSTIAQAISRLGRPSSSGGGSSSNTTGQLSQALAQVQGQYSQAASRASQAVAAGITNPDILTAYQSGQLTLEQARLAQQASQFSQTMAFNQSQAGGTPIDWARLGEQVNAQDFNEWLQTQQLGLAGSAQDLNAQSVLGNLDIARNNQLLQQYVAQTGVAQNQAQFDFNTWLAQQNLGMDAAKLNMSGYQISSNVDIANRQVSLAEQLGMGDQAQGWAKLGLAAELQDLNAYFGEQNLQMELQRLGVDLQSANLKAEIDRARIQLDRELGSAQAAAAQAGAAASMAHADAAQAQARAALRGVEVQLELGQGNLGLGYAELPNARELGLDRLQFDREQLGEKTRIETASLELQKYLGMAGIQAQMAGINQRQYEAELNSAT